MSLCLCGYVCVYVCVYVCGCLGYVSLMSCDKVGKMK